MGPVTMSSYSGAIRNDCKQLEQSACLMLELVTAVSRTLTRDVEISVADGVMQSV